MKRKGILGAIARAGLVMVSACNIPGSPATVSQPTQDATAAIESQVAGIVAATKAAQTSFANALAGTRQSLVTGAPEFTFTPSLTPSLTGTLTL